MTFKRIRLYRLPVPVEFDGDKGTLTFDAGTMPAVRWVDYADRITKNLIRLGMIANPPAAKAVSLAGQFIANNRQTISAAKRGRIKRAPIWLRWYCDSVVTKEPFVDEE